LAGGALAFGGFEALTQDARTPEEMWVNFEHGVRNGLVFHALGAAHGKMSRALMGKKFPKWLAEPLGASAAGVGFGVLELGTGEGMPFADSEVGGALHGFLKDPTEDTWQHYARVMGKNILGMMLHSSIFGKHAAQANAERVAQERVQKEAVAVSKRKREQLTEYVEKADVAPEKPAPKPEVMTLGAREKPGVIQRLTAVTRRRMKMREKLGDKYEQRELGGVFVRPVLGGRVFGAVGRGRGRSVNLEAIEGQLEATLKKELGPGVATRLMTDLRTGGRFASVHTHEAPLTFSETDLVTYTRKMFERGGREPQILVTPEGVEVVLPIPGRTPAVTADFKETLQRRTKEIQKDQANWLKKAVEGTDLNPAQVLLEIRRHNQGLPVKKEYRELVDTFFERDRQLLTELAEQMGMEHIVMTSAEGARSFEAWMETGSTAVFRKPPPARPERAPVAERLKEDVRVEPEFEGDPGAARAIREVLAEQGEAAAWREAEVLLGEDAISGLPRTEGMLPRLIAGLEGKPADVPLERWEVGREARAAAEARERAELSMPGEPPRQTEQKIMESLSPDRQKQRTQAKGVLKRALSFQPITDVGYLTKFKGPDYELLVTAQDRLVIQGQETWGLVGREMARILEPLTPKEGPRKERIKATEENVKQLEIYAGLKDLTSNYMQKRWVADPETGEMRLVEVPSKLPGGYKIEDYMSALEKMEAELRPEVRRAYETAREVLDTAWLEFANTKGFDPTKKQTDFWPRRVMDFADMSHMGQGKPAGHPRDPFRSYAKSRTGTERAVEFSLEGLHAYLTKMRYDNAIHEWMRMVGNGVQERAEQETGASLEQMAEMSAKKWREFYDAELAPRGFRAVDFRTGERGRVQFERSLEAWDAYEALQSAIPDMPTVGRRVRPDGRNRFLVTQQALDLMLAEKQRTAWTSPLWRKANQVIGQWFKVPALRGPFGIATPARQFRNTISDLQKIWEQDSLSATVATVKQLPFARRILKKVEARERGKEVELTAEEQSLWDEFQFFGTGGRGEFTGIDFQGRDVPMIERFDPTLRPAWKKVVDKVRGDTAWAKRMDMHYENWVRLGYFLGERLQAKTELSTYDAANKLAPNPEQMALLRDIHLKGSRTLVNYNHLTPFERTALNGALIPFYTWARWNLAGTLQAFKEKPGWTAAKVAGPALAMHLFNRAVFGDEEERLVDNWPGIAARPHLITPIKDSLGNPLVLWFQAPSMEGLSMLGIDTLIGEAPAAANALFEGEPGAAWQRLGRGWFHDTKQAAQRMVNPLLAWGLQREYESKFRGGPGVPQVGDLETGIGRVSPTLGHIAGLTDIVSEVLGEPGGVRPDKTAFQRAARYAPFLSFLDISRGLPYEAQPREFVIGQAQSEEQLMSARYRRYSRLLAKALRARNLDRARSIFEAAWGEVEPTATRYGLTQEAILARMMRSAKREIAKEKLVERGLPPKLATLTKRQASMLYERLTR
jgi:hypothetical protein